MFRLDQLVDFLESKGFEVVLTEGRLVAEHKRPVDRTIYDGIGFVDLSEIQEFPANISVKINSDHMGMNLDGLQDLPNNVSLSCKNESEIFLNGLLRISGESCKLYASGGVRMDSLEKIDGQVEIWSLSPNRYPELRSICGELNIEDAHGISLPELETVEGRLHIDAVCESILLPKLKTLGPNISIDNAAVCYLDINNVTRASRKHYFGWHDRIRLQNIDFVFNSMKFLGKRGRVYSKELDDVPHLKHILEGDVMFKHGDELIRFGPTQT